MTAEAPLRVLFAAAEVSPFAKVGGLADVAGSLPGAIAAGGHDVRVITPAHHVPEGAAPVGTGAVSVLGVERPFRLLRAATAAGAPVYFVENAGCFGGRPVYDGPDDMARYYFFSLAVLEAPQLLGWYPQIYHCNDWHTAWLPFGRRNYAWDREQYRGSASVLTIHNLAYRGPDQATDLLCPGIYYADAVSTVSPTYAAEITTPEQGQGLESLLQLRRDRLYGILNGLDTEAFNPSTDPALPANYSVDSLHLRVENKVALQERTGLRPDPGAPLIGMVTRLDYQKGIDLVLAVADRIADELGAQLVVLGAGNPEYQESLQQAAQRHPGAIRAEFGYNAELGQQIYGGADLFLMPSRFEPCGLGQLIAMHYGAVPVVRRTGGLADTVIDASPDLSAGTGFVFDGFSPGALLDALRRAVSACRGESAGPEAWRLLQGRAMSQDFSWGASAGRYVDMYREALIRAGGG